MTRKTYMPMSEVQQFEKMTSAQIGSLLGHLGTQKFSEQIESLARSLRIAATVANAAWKLIKEVDGTGTISYEISLELRKALNLYSPGNFQPYASDLEFGCRLLEELYDHLSKYTDHPNAAAVMMEQLFERIQQMRAVLPSAL